MADQEGFIDVHFPKAGIDNAGPFFSQKPRQVGEEEWARSAASANNVRGFEPVSKRSRGGSRSGLSKYFPLQVAGTEFIVQDLNTLVTDQTVQTSQSGRIVTVVAVSQGNIFYAVSGDTVWSVPTNLTGNVPPLNYTGVMQSAANNQKLYFADGTNWVFFDPHLTTVNTWTATAGTLPVDVDGNTPRLIATWRGRTVLSGLLLDPQDWFMSAVGDPTDWDYAPLSTTPTQAIAGQNAPQGLIGDVVTALVPYTDDILIVGGDHSIYMFTGDPMAGGQIDLVTDAVGFAWGQAWCKDPYGTVYFMSNKVGIYALQPGQKPQRISQGIEQLLLPIDTGLNVIRLLWDDRFQGLHVFCTLVDSPGATTHFFFEQRTGAWWTDTFANTNHNPIACCTFDGNLTSDRISLLGGWDGYVRAIDPDATDDDGTPIASSVVIGPLLTQDLDSILLKDMQMILGVGSGNVRYDVYVGQTAELALASTAVESGTWGSSPSPRNLTTYIRRSGWAIYVKLSSSVAWNMEAIRLRIISQGKVQRRGR